MNGNSIHRVGHSGHDELVLRVGRPGPGDYTSPPMCGPMQYSGGTADTHDAPTGPMADHARVARGSPSTCCEDDYDVVFDRQEALSDLNQWRSGGPAKATRRLLDALQAEGVEGASVLDVGAGVGVVHLELLQAGATSATDVDLSHAFLEVARDEAERLGVADRVDYRHGDFTAIADELPEADFVTMDRVVCCYPDLAAMLGSAARRARRAIGIVHPWDAWPVRLGIAIENLVRRPFRGGDCTFFVHRRATMDAVLADAGFAPVFRSGTWFWRVVVYRRA